MLRGEKRIIMLERKIEVNGIYRHFKGHLYRVIGVGKDSSDLSEKVIYENVDTKEIWIRDKGEFLSLVDSIKYPDVDQKYRFELIE